MSDSDRIAQIRQRAEARLAQHKLLVNASGVTTIVCELCHEQNCPDRTTIAGLLSALAEAEQRAAKAEAQIDPLHADLITAAIRDGVSADWITRVIWPLVSAELPIPDSLSLKRNPSDA